VILQMDEQLERAIPDRTFVDAMRHGIAKFSVYRSHVPFVPYAYSRTSLEKTDAYELVIMQWAPGSLSAIHDHGNSRCWVAMLEGMLDVENFLRLDDERDGYAGLQAESTFRLKAGDLDCRSGPKELHRVRNAANRPAFSLQLYAAPLSTYSIVDERTGRCITGVSQFDSILDLSSL